MKRMKIADLTPEMVLASDVINCDGRFLLPAGAALTERSIRLCKAWGIVEAEIEGEEAPSFDAGRNDVDPAALAAARRINEYRFLHAGTKHRAMRELENLSSLRKARAIEQGLPGGRFSVIGDDDAEAVDDNVLLEPINLGRLSEFGLRLPTLPAVFDRINETIMNPNSSAGDIADVIGKDTALTSQLLGIVNSAFYGFVSKIDTVSRAVAIVGTKQLTSLVFGISVIKIFDRIPARHIDMQEFWRHSLACGIAARIIAGYKQIQNTERLFVAGLLHDIGRLLMYRLWPEHSRRVLFAARRESRLLYEVEKDLLDIDHAGIGALMAERWKLPFLLEAEIRNHHAPGNSYTRPETAIVHLADIIAHVMEMGSSGEIFVPPLDEDTWNSLDISENLLTVIIDHVDRQINDVTAYFFPGS
ncbi:MAG TPA: HDOD domain-containing protein [Deltaproteobacteria bacterium]|nr:HDOD domain-containing protein [Deltaproteobacteria bacterium]